jgi:hypothetical protein
MKKENKLLNKFIKEGWHEKQCPAHSNQMQKESDCVCLYGFVVELLGGDISKLDSWSEEPKDKVIMPESVAELAKKWNAKEPENGVGKT